MFNVVDHNTKDSGCCRMLCFCLIIPSLFFSFCCFFLLLFCSNVTKIHQETEADISCAPQLQITHPVQRWSNQSPVFLIVHVSPTSTESQVGQSAHHF